MLLVQLLDHLQEEAQEPGAQKEEEKEEESIVYGSSQQMVFMKGCQVSILFRMVAT